MSVKRGIITQSAADTFTQSTIQTGLTPDGKTGWQIVGITGYWSTGDTVAAADVEVNMILSTVTSVTTFDNVDEIARLNWAVSNTAGVAVAFPLELIKRDILTDNGRLTVQPTVYVGAASSGTSVANVLYYEIEYNTIKLTDLEVLRLLQGGV